MFEFDLSDELRHKIKKLAKKSPETAVAINKKIKQIINNDLEIIDRYKNLKYGLKDLKRVHILKSFVLTFRVHKDENFILFMDFDHHDNIY